MHTHLFNMFWSCTIYCLVFVIMRSPSITDINDKGTQVLRVANPEAVRGGLATTWI